MKYIGMEAEEGDSGYTMRCVPFRDDIYSLSLLSFLMSFTAKLHCISSTGLMKYIGMEAGEGDSGYTMSCGSCCKFMCCLGGKSEKDEMHEIKEQLTTIQMQVRVGCISKGLVGRDTMWE